MHLTKLSLTVLVFHGVRYAVVRAKTQSVRLLESPVVHSHFKDNANVKTNIPKQFTRLSTSYKVSIIDSLLHYFINNTQSLQSRVFGKHPKLMTYFECTYRPYLKFAIHKQGTEYMDDILYSHSGDPTWFWSLEGKKYMIRQIVPYFQHQTLHVINPTIFLWVLYWSKVDLVLLGIGFILITFWICSCLLQFLMGIFQMSSMHMCPCCTPLPPIGQVPDLSCQIQQLGISPVYVHC